MTIVRRIREMAGMTQAELASVADTSQPAIAAYESGAKLPSLRTMQRLASVVGLDLDIRVTPALTREDRRSLLLHSRIAERLLSDPDVTLVKARANLATMKRLHPGASALLDQWEQILGQPVDVVVEAMTDVRPRFRELRQVTPFAGVLDPGDRAAVYSHFRRS